MKRASIQIGHIVRDRSREVTLKSVGIVVGPAKSTGQFRICRWRGGAQHWMQPVAIAAGQLEPVADWTLMPLTEAKRLAAAVFERHYLVRVMEAAKDSVVDAAFAAGVDRSNFRRLLQRHGLVKASPPPKPRKRQKGRRKDHQKARQKGRQKDRKRRSK